VPVVTVHGYRRRADPGVNARSGSLPGASSTDKALPWLAAIGLEYAVIRRFFAADLAESPVPVASAAGAGGAMRSGVKHGSVPYHRSETTAGLSPEEPADSPDIPVFTPGVVAATLGGFVVASAAGASPAWAALGGALVLAVRALARGDATVASIARGADVPFLLFVLALGVVVTALVGNGLGSALRPLVPAGSGLTALFALAALAAGLAAVVNKRAR